MHFTIRDYLPGDFKAVYQLWESVGTNYPGRDDTEASIVNTFAFQGRLLLAINSADQSIIGTLWLTCDGRRMHMHHLGVHVEFRLMGIATALVKEGLAYAARLKVQVRLDVQKQNPIPCHIFEKLGFYGYPDYNIYVLRKVNEASPS